MKDTFHLTVHDSSYTPPLFFHYFILPINSRNIHSSLPSVRSLVTHGSSKLLFLLLCLFLVSYVLLAQDATITEPDDYIYATDTTHSVSTIDDNHTINAIKISNGITNFTADNEAVVTFETISDLYGSAQTVFAEGDAIINFNGNKFILNAILTPERGGWVTAVSGTSYSQINFNAKEIDINVTGIDREAYGVAVDNVTFNSDIVNIKVNNENTRAVAIADGDYNNDDDVFGNIIFNTKTVNLIAEGNGYKAAGMEFQGKSNVMFNTGDVYVNAKAPNDQAHGIYGDRKTTVTVTADKLIIDVEGGTVALGMAHIGESQGYYNAKELEIYAYGEISAVGVIVQEDGIVKLNNEKTKIITASGNLKHEEFDQPKEIALLSQIGGTLLVNAKDDGSVYNPDSIVEMVGDIHSIFGFGGTGVTANLTNEKSYLRGQLISTILYGEATVEFWEEYFDEVIDDINIYNGIINLNLSNGAKWQVTGDENSRHMANVALNGGVIDLAWWSQNQIAESLATNDTYRTITLNNVKIIDEGILKINSDVQNGVADLLIVEELDSDSSQNITQYIQIGYDPFINEFIKSGITSPDPMELDSPILVMEITNNNGKNVVGDDIYNRFDSKLSSYKVSGTVSTDTNGNLTRIYLGNITVSKNNDPSEAITVADDTAVILKWISRTQNDNLTHRMGDLRLNSESHNNGLWARTYVVELDNDGNYDGRNIKQNIFGGQLGYDKQYKKEDSTVFAGLFIDYLNSENKYFSGKGKTQNIGVAAYGSWLSNAGHYVDVTARVSKIDGDFDILNVNGDAITADYDTWGMALSAEYGYRMKANTNWIIEPQAQLTYNNIGGMNYDLSNDVNVKYGNIDSFIGRIGVSTGYEFAKGNVTAGLNYFHDFAGAIDMIATADIENFETKLNAVDSWGRFNVGATLNLSENNTLYLELARLFGGGINNNWLFNAGFRVGF